MLTYDTFCAKIKAIINMPNVGDAFCEKNRNRAVYLYGAGHAAPYFKSYLENHGVTIKGTILSKAEEEREDVIPLDRLSDMDDADIVIAAPSYIEEIKQEISKRKIKNRVCYFDVELYQYYNNSSRLVKEFLQKNVDGLYQTYMMLEDEKSRTIMMEILAGRATSDLDLIKESWEENQYWPDDIIRFSADENIIECGSWDGGTLELLCRKLDEKYNHIYCFEPDPGVFEKLESVARKHKNITTFQYGTWDKKETLKFDNSDAIGGIQCVSEAGSIEIELVPIDEVVTEPISYIKMDIEGAELKTLQGASGIIEKYNPILAVCVYHKNEDMVQIPKFIRSCSSDYRFYLRHHNCNMTETVLYAIPKSRQIVL